MEKVIKLNESDIKEIIEEVVNEVSINAKKRNIDNIRGAFEKGKSGYNAIKTFAVFTAENPDSQYAGAANNRRFNKSLVADLKNGGYIVVPAKGKFGNTEHSFMVLNIDLDTCKYLCGKYQQTSFVYHILENGQVISEYWEKADTNAPYHPQSNDYVKKDSEVKYTDKSNADDFYTSVGGNVGREFKYSIPFSIFNEMNERINENLQMIVEGRAKNGFKDTIEEIFDYAHKLNNKNAGNGMYRTAMRKAINKLD